MRRGELDTNGDIQSNRIAYLRQPDQMPAYVHTHTYLGVAYGTMAALRRMIPRNRGKAWNIHVDREGADGDQQPQNDSLSIDRNWHDTTQGSGIA